MFLLKEMFKLTIEMKQVGNTVADTKAEIHDVGETPTVKYFENSNIEAVKAKY